jgi:hypothetical protein
VIGAWLLDRLDDLIAYLVRRRRENAVPAEE